MFKYILFSLFLIAYFEVLGQYFLYRINVKNETISLGIGFLFMMAFSYISTGILGALHVSFYLVFLLFALFILVSLFFIIKDFKKVPWYFNYKQWIVVLIFVGIMLYYAYNTTLGYPNSFDSTYYLNLITSNIKADALNMTSLFFGNITSEVPPAYQMQSYFTFVSSVVLVIRKILSFFGSVHNSEIIIWLFQIIFDFFLASAIVAFIIKLTKEKKLLNIVLLVIFIFYIGKLYFNNVFGFYGNSYRTVCMGYSVMFLYDLIKENNFANKTLLLIAIWGNCALTSTATFVNILMLYAAFFVLIDKDDNLFKYYAIVLFVPLVNLFLVMEPMNIYVSLLISGIISLVLYLFNDLLTKLFRLKYSRYVVLILSFVAMFGLSFYITKDLFDFNAFFNNISETYDMSINYFSLSRTNNIRNIYVVLVLVITFLSLFLEGKNRLIMAFWILIIVFFNPFCCSFLNRINQVYYRAYDIIINPFTLVLFFKIIFDHFNNKYVYYGSLAVILALFVLNIDFIKPMYYHFSFIPDENYNKDAKMNNDELEIIDKIYNNIIEYSEDNPYIVTNNMFTQSNIPNARYLFGRDYPLNEFYSINELKLYNIFKDVEEENNTILDGESLKDLNKNIEESGVDYIVLKNDVVYYDKEDDNYYYLIHYMYELGNVIYTNKTYSLFAYKH